MKELTQHQIETVYKYAIRSLLAGKGREALIEDLIKRKIPEETATNIVDRAIKAKRFKYRKQGIQDLLKGLAFMVSGVVIMGATLGFEDSSAKSVITIGLFMMGGVFFLRGIYRLTMG